MAGLREEKKRAVREKIMEAALEIFLSEGFEAATTKKISRRAGVGEGTIYNHFQSKSEILMALYDERFNSFRDGPMPVVRQKGKRARDYLLDFFDHYFNEISKMSKEWLRELFLMIYRGGNEASNHYKSLMKTDELVLDRLSEYLEELKRAEIIGSNVETEPLIEVIYALFMLHYSRYTVVEEMSYEEFISPLKKSVGYAIEKYIG